MDMKDVLGDRSSNVDFDDCDQCARENGSGICSNCEDDGSYCPECDSTGKCKHCEGTGRVPFEPSPEEIEAIAEAGPLIEPED